MRRLAKCGTLLLLAGALFFGIVPVAGAADIHWPEVKKSVFVHIPDDGENGAYLAAAVVGDNQLVGQRVDAYGQPLDSAKTWLQLDGEEQWISDLAVAYDAANNRFFVVWETNALSGDRSLAYGFVNGGNADQLYGQQPLCTDCRAPAVAVGPEGIAVVYLKGSFDEMYVQYVPFSGAMAEPAKISGVDRWVAGETIRIVSVGEGRFFVAYAFSSGYELMGKYLHLTQHPDGDPELVEEQEDYLFAKDDLPFALAAANGEAVILLHKQRDYNQNVEHLSITRAVYGADPLDIQIASGGYREFTSLSLAPLSDDRYVILMGRNFYSDQEWMETTDVYGFVVQGGSGSFTEPEWMALMPNRSRAELVYHPGLELHNPAQLAIALHLDLPYGSAPVLMPYGEVYTMPDPVPALMNPKLSYDPSRGVYVMLAMTRGEIGDASLHFYRMHEGQPAGGDGRLGSVEQDLYGDMAYDVAYGSGKHLAVWMLDGQTLYGRFIQSDDTELAGQPFEILLEEDGDIRELHLLHHEKSNRFILFYLHESYDGQATTYRLNARTIDGNGTASAASLLWQAASGYPERFHVVALDDARMAAAWLEDGYKLSIQALLVDEGGQVAPHGPAQFTELPESGQIYSFRVSRGGSGPELMVGWHAYSYQQQGDSIRWLIASLQEETWHFSESSSVSVPLESDEMLQDFALHAGGFLAGDPVLAWLKMDGRGRATLSVYYPHRLVRHDIPIQPDMPANAGEVRLVPGNNRINLYASMYFMDVMPADAWTGLLAIAIDFAAELEEMGTGERITIEDVVKYINKLETEAALDPLRYALLMNIERLLDMIEPRFSGPQP